MTTTFDLKNIVRPNIWDLAPYASARDEFEGEASVYLDANENAFGSVGQGQWNRYPDPLQKVVKEKLSAIKNIPWKQIFLGNGSDEAIDLLYRIFCTPGQDAVLTFEPTYGMYKVSADINNVAVKSLPLTADFQLPVDDALDHIKKTSSLKLIFICHPNNPSGNLMKRADIEQIIEAFSGIVVVDEAYIDFAPEASFVSALEKYSNLVVLQTFSKAWGLAALRLGMAFASSEIISLYNKVKPPYNINQSTQNLALEALADYNTFKAYLQNALEQRDVLIEALKQLSFIKQVFPSDANFVLCETTDAPGIYKYLTDKGIIVRNRHKVFNNSLRITVGTPQENKSLIEALKQWQ